MKNFDSYYDPPDDDPACEDGCGDTLVKEWVGVAPLHHVEKWICKNRFCPTKFQGVEKEMAEALVEYMDKAHTSEERLRYRKLELDDLKLKYDDLMRTTNQWKEMYYKMTNERDELEYRLNSTNK